jgi:hypothetical protein
MNSYFHGIARIAHQGPDGDAAAHEDITRTRNRDSTRRRRGPSRVPPLAAGEFIKHLKRMHK